MNNLVLRNLNVTDAWQPLSSNRLVATITLSCPPGNQSPVLVRSVDDPAHETPLVPGEWHTLQRVDLARVQFKGAASGDTVTVVGGSW